MRGRFRRFAMPCLLALLLLLLLSALVDAPSPEVSAVKDAQPLQGLVLCMPPCALPAQEALPAAPSAPLWKLFTLTFALAFALPLLCAAHRDANGRILRARSYARSVSFVFRQEAACG